MSGDRTADLVFACLLIALPLAALIARSPPLGRTIKMALAWVAIFAIGLLVVGQRDRLGSLSLLLSDQRVSGGETRIHIANDGHFWADVAVDGVRRRMLVDSGATTTAISVGTARAARLDLDQSPFPTILTTANGEVAARTATVKQLTIGNIEARDLGVVVAPAFGDTDVIGMNFLSRLGAWRVEGTTLILTPAK